MEGAGLPQLGVDLTAIGVGLEAVLAVVLRDQRGRSVQTSPWAPKNSARIASSRGKSSMA